MTTQPLEDLLQWTLADRMTKALRVAGLKTHDMAEYLGMSRNSVSNWINGRITPDTRTLRLFALRTGVPYEWLLTGEMNGQGGPDGPKARPSDMEWAVAELKNNPGKWARVRASAKTRAVTSWKRAGLEVLAAPAEAKAELWDIYARAPENRPPAKRPPVMRAAPTPGSKSVAPALTPSAAPADEAVEDGRALAVPVPPNDSEESPEAKAVTEAWRGRLGHKQTKAGGRRG